MKEKRIYHEKISFKIKDLKDSIKRVRALDDALKLAEEILPERSNIWIDYEVNCDWAAKSMTEVKVILREFAKRKAMLDRFVESTTCPIWNLIYYGQKIRLCPRWSMEEGASCKLVKVGEDTHTIPRYKLICDGKEVDGGTT